jgi:hypothetical protein
LSSNGVAAFTALFSYPISCTNPPFVLGQLPQLAKCTTIVGTSSLDAPTALGLATILGVVASGVSFVINGEL